MEGNTLEVIEDLSAGGVVFRRDAGGPLFLVGDQVDWRTGDRNVRLPKGHLDPGETLEDAARREVREETGRAVKLVGPLAEHQYAFDVPEGKKKGRPAHRVDKRVVFFLMEDDGVHADGKDDEMERVHWLGEHEACERLTFENERDMIRLAARRIADIGD